MGDILTRKTKIGSKKMKIREALETDFDDVLLIERLAFGYDKEANLVRELLHDPSAKPLLSLLALKLVFVLGHPEYYPRFGFTPAGRLGFGAPYPIPDELAGAWMVQALRSGVIGIISGKVICADALNKPEHWRE